MLFTYLNNNSFTPLDIPGLVLWMDASDASTITQTAGSVSAWYDKSGNGYIATQATGANQPITGARTLNGLNVLNFDGSSDFLNLGVTDLGSTRLFAGATDQYSVFTFVQYDALGGYPISKRTNANSQFGFLRGGGGNNQILQLHRGAQATQATVSGVSTAFQGCVWDGLTMKTYYNNSTAVTFSAGSSAELIGENILIGARTQSSPTFFLDGGLGEIIVSDQGITQSVVDQIYTYGIYKWGTP